MQSTAPPAEALAGQAGSSRRARPRRALPGFGLSLGYSLVWLGLLVVLPLSALVVKASHVGFAGALKILGEPRVQAAFALSFGASLVASLLNVVFGVVVAWVLARYRFPGKSLVDALVDLPFALPTAVAGIALTALWGPQGPLGRLAALVGIKVAFAPAGVVLALVFVGLPFVVRTVQPVLLELDPSVEEAAAVLGATRLQTFLRVLLPTIGPHAITGFALAFARALGEYGSIVFISGNMPMKTEIVPLLIVTRLEQYDYDGATAIATAMLLLSFLLLLGINALQAARRGAR
jgi:sulfate transport system permease protein